LLEGRRSNNGGRESELWSVSSQNESLDEEDDCCGAGPGGINTTQGPTVVYGWHCLPSQNRHYRPYRVALPP
jgi:hypothetical protein